MIFLLKFEEQCEKGSAAKISAGTMTSTAVNAEQKDSDPRCQDYSALLRSEVLLGTKSHTLVCAEAPDADASCPQLGALPHSAQINLGTCTHTRIRAEECDSDQGHGRFNALR